MKRLLMCSLFLIISTQMLGGIKNVSIDFELNETAINRAIVSQFNDPNLPFKEFTGTFELLGVINVPYYVELARPTVVIENNSIGINMAFSFEASIGNTPYNYDFNVTPSISVAAGSITGSNVVAFLEDLDDKINETNMEPDIKVLLIGLYEVFKPQIYASNLYNEILDEINSNEFIAQRAFSITDFGIASAFVSNKFVVKAIVEITYGTTSFYSKVGYNTGDDFVRFGSNIKCKVVSVIVWAMGGEVYKNENLNIELAYNENYNFDYYGEINMGNALTSTQPYYIWYVLYRTNETFYYNKYYGSPNNWDTPELKINH